MIYCQKVFWGGVTNMNILELLKPYYNPSNGDKVLSVRIIGPYPTKDFFKELFNSLNFDKRYNNIIFLVDKSSYNKAEKKKKSLITEKICNENQFIIQPITGNKGRFIHSKMYYFEIKKYPSNMIYTCLITGSGNASTRAYSFEGRDYKNAEVNVVTTIKYLERDFIENYFDLKNFEIDKYKDIEDDKYVLHIDTADMNIHFPQIKSADISHKEYNSLFSNWVLNGYIYHQYVRVNDLGKVRIRLEHPISAQNEFSEKLLQNRNFDSKIEAHSISYTYIETAKEINFSNERDNEDSKDNIKSTYLCETSYGYWAPKELKNIIDEKISKNPQKKKRENLLDNIARLNDNNIITLTNTIIEELQTIIGNMEEKDKNNYFKMNGNVLDEDYYRGMISSQIIRHNKKCQTEIFRNRYIYGYDSFNASYLENCIDDLADEVLDYINIKLTSDRVFNLVCQAVKNITNYKNYSTDEVDENFLESNLDDIINILEKMIKI